MTDAETEHGMLRGGRTVSFAESDQPRAGHFLRTCRKMLAKMCWSGFEHPENIKERWYGGENSLRSKFMTGMRGFIAVIFGSDDSKACKVGLKSRNHVVTQKNSFFAPWKGEVIKGRASFARGP